MSITKSYNKHTDTYYAYDTTYVWDEKSQKKVQKKVCIGKFDPETGNIIPNAKRGRPLKSKTLVNTGKPVDAESSDIVGSFTPEQMAAVLDEMKAIKVSLSELMSRFQKLEQQLECMKNSVSAD